MNRKSKQGQAAIEFLSTYGWAVLVIALVLAALVWLGVFNTGQGIPNRCSFDGSVQCDDVRLKYEYPKTKFVNMEVTNRLSNTIYVCAVMCTNNLDLALSDPAVPAVDECASAGKVAIIIQPGKTAQIAPGPPYGVSLFSFDVCVEYFAGSAVTQSNYRAGDRFTGGLVLFYSLATDAGSGSEARIMLGDLVTTIE